MWTTIRELYPTWAPKAWNFVSLYLPCFEQQQQQQQQQIYRKKPETWKQSRYSNWNNFQHGSAFLFLIALLHHLRSADISQEPWEDGRICDRLFHLLCIPWPESYRHLILLVSLKRQWDWPGKGRNRTKSPFLWESLFCRLIRLDSFRLIKTMD